MVMVPSKHNNISSGRILALTYAFPPFKVQMAPVIAKQMAAISQLGYSVDVLCADPMTFPIIGIDNSLDEYIKENFSNIYQLKSPYIINTVKNKLQKFSCYGDPMSKHQWPMFELLMAMDLHNYDAIVTFSPFHSINLVMVEVKKRKKDIFWVAHFGDPWASNPLELENMRKFWDKRHEIKMLHYIDCLVHNSKYSLELMLKNKPNNRVVPYTVFPHIFTKELYPKRPKATNLKTTIRYVGTFFGNRSPEPMFKAFLKLFERRKDLVDKVGIEFIGIIKDNTILKTPACLSLPKGMLSVIPSVSYIKSLELMYDSDILLLIEEDVRQNLFFPSKLADYIGANTPIVGVIPSGSSEEICKQLGAWHVKPSNIDAISEKLENAIDYCHSKNKQNWCNENYRNQFESHFVAQNYINFMENVKGLIG